jgi:hypothetical protein
VSHSNGSGASSLVSLHVGLRHRWKGSSSSCVCAGAGTCRYCAGTQHTHPAEPCCKATHLGTHYLGELHTNPPTLLW